ncbi:GNAT family N-acetyltransferase [Amycolatopsis sp. WQ 127309]|uniref:GNAT family N-acetyltransferase n=1 Tax=Amycolatopsis sp. WQ 127309 TaxID=2932773 RepID=UPI001FF22C27|nr:GNAT family N-acetyltransferase [Amycolatopsis sp. WQ 127309]UOZ03452.1 GNAT family N-acetyltransferase [Amycolatopsis sp. WQ 127309]
MKSVISPETAEQSEAEALYRFETAAPQSVRSVLGIDALRIGGGVAMAMRHDVTGYWSKALGFGCTAPITDELIGAVCRFYREQRVAGAVFQVSPALLPADWAEVRARHGLTAGSSWVKLVADVDEAVALADAGEGLSRLDVAPVELGDAGMWASAMMRAFGMPEESYPDMAAATVGLPGWHAHAAWLDGELVGTGTVYVRGETAQMFGGAVLPAARRRGGQTALLAARARLAQKLGCRWLVAETGVEQPGEHNSSLHNMLRLGFERLYERRNWSWRPEQE